MKGIHLVVTSLLVCACVARARWVVRFNPGQQQRVLDQLEAAGYDVQVRGSFFAAVTRRAGIASAEDAAAAMDALGSLGGVHGVERDSPRYLIKPNRPASFPGDESALGPQSGPANCTATDTKLGSGDDAEVVPFGITMVQGDSQKLINSTVDAGVIVCITDTGMDPDHPDLKKDDVDGCGDGAASGCPFRWNYDGVGHGTHVAGTIAARRNGANVVGVIPEGAELYIVRVFDSNSDQGVVYGSNMVAAYSQCESALGYAQATRPDKHYRLVMSMSLGGTGPLTIESIWFSQAYQRGDMLFVAASGNNGTDAYQWSSYPASYTQVMSVAAVDCNKQRAAFSQHNAGVDISGPGVDVLSSVPTTLGFRKGKLLLEDEAAAVFPSDKVYSPDYSGVGNVTGVLVDCGLGDKPCPAATNGSVCLIQGGGNISKYNCDRVSLCMEAGAAAVVLVPKAGLFDNETYPATMDCTLSGCNCWFTLVQMLDQIPPVVAVSGAIGRSLRAELTAAANATSVRAHAAARRVTVSHLPADDGSANITAPAPPPANTTSPPPPANTTSPPPPANTTSPPPPPAPAASNGTSNDTLGVEPEGVMVTVITKPSVLAKFSGTSMATPHVSGVAARVWASFPHCTNVQLREALEKSAAPLGGMAPGTRNNDFGYGLVQAQAAHDYLLAQPCGQLRGKVRKVGVRQPVIPRKPAPTSTGKAFARPAAGL